MAWFAGKNQKVGIVPHTVDELGPHPRPPWRAWLQHENGHPALPCDSIGFSRCDIRSRPNRPVIATSTATLVNEGTPRQWARGARVGPALRDVRSDGAAWRHGCRQRIARPRPRCRRRGRPANGDEPITQPPQGGHPTSQVIEELRKIWITRVDAGEVDEQLPRSDVHEGREQGDDLSTFVGLDGSFDGHVSFVDIDVT